ncbi:hypothetical protein WOLCODRAFT_161036 [Wolfiporia cocos MD-104 SS10]|uniref:F-box domain-containing protein n=1 Tax=Wolfiporia cocos (strain MD-104) TaxID=742152 RepID=A0A2H3JD86_WOLCO|nr:hypothetical protein WOLCODRAFT_161036 [Wolfiporia cocos MD-104 SS10]
MAKHVELLPSDVIAQILSHLDTRTLLRCRSVSRQFRMMVDETAEQQYKIELTVAGMEDGPISMLGSSDRLKLLREHQKAWETLDYKRQDVVPMLAGEVWELYGGVLAQAQGGRTLCFCQLPSVLRGIEEKRWTLKDLGFVIRDFGMDLSQDLLVAIQRSSRRSNLIHIHLHALSTGAAHPSAPSPAILTHRPEGNDPSYTISVSGEYLGILFDCDHDRHNELVIWNWKSGARELWYCSRRLHSFIFLSERHVLLGLVQSALDNDFEMEHDSNMRELELAVVDFINASSDKVEVSDEAFTCSFHYPQLADWSLPLSVDIRADPAPSWTPHPDLRVPFFTSRGDRLLVITFWVAEGGARRTLLLFTLSSTILSRVESMQGKTGHHIAWEDWGPTKTRIISAPHPHSSVWVCYVFGTKFVSMWRNSKDVGLRVFEFNILPHKQRLAQQTDPSDVEAEEPRFISDPSISAEQHIFRDEVTTSLSYRVQSVTLPPVEGEKGIEAVMVSEDSLITLGKADARGRTYRILTF